MSCKDEPSTPYQYETDPVYTIAKAVFYGAYYSGAQIESNVLSLDLYTDGMLNEEGELIGTGQHLQVEDLFIPSDKNTLVPGTYTISKQREEFTFYPGENLKIDYLTFVVGARIIYIEPNRQYSTQKLITEGTFTVTETDITFNLITSDKKELKGSFTADIQYTSPSKP